MTYTNFLDLMTTYTFKHYTETDRKKITRGSIEHTLFNADEDHPFKYQGSNPYKKQDVYITGRYIQLRNQALPKTWKDALQDSENYEKLLDNINQYLKCNIQNEKRRSKHSRNYYYKINYTALSNGLKIFDTFINNFVKNNPFQKLDVLFLCKIGIFIYIQVLANEDVLENPPNELITILKNELAIYEKEKETEFLNQLKQLSSNMTFLEAIFLENKDLFSLDEIIIGIKNRTNLSELIGAVYQQFDSEYSKHFSFKTSLTDTSKMILTALFLSPEEKQPEPFFRNVFDTLIEYLDTILFFKKERIINFDNCYYQINYFHREPLKDICLTSDYNQNKELLELLVKKYESSDDLIQKQLLPIIIALIEKIEFDGIGFIRTGYCFRIIRSNHRMNTEMMQKIQAWLSN